MTGLFFLECVLLIMRVIEILINMLLFLLNFVFIYQPIGNPLFVKPFQEGKLFQDRVNENSENIVYLTNPFAGIYFSKEQREELNFCLYNLHII